MSVNAFYSSQRASSANGPRCHEEVREKVKTLINAPHLEEVIFVRGTTEAINLVAHAWVVST